MIVNLHQLGLLPHWSLQAMAEKYGPIMLLRLGQVPTLVISTADMAAEVFKAQDHIFSSRSFLEVDVVTKL
jgi:cytochrome P450 family 71 subfamily A